MKFGYVCVYGRANVGKSTIINKCLGFKLLSVSNKPQTTRDNIHAIYNDDDAQIVFTDTPGIFKPHGKLGSILLRDAESAKEGVDLIVYVIDASDRIDDELINNLKKETCPILLAFNKIDLVTADVGERKLKHYVDELKPYKYFRLSAKEGVGVDELLAEIKKLLPEGERQFSLDQVSDRPMQFVISEMIREKCMRLLEKEVPHSIYVDIRGVVEDEDSLEVYADIIVEKDSEKAIVIGKGGQMIKKIRQYSESSVQSYFGVPAYIDLHVKTVKDWRNDDRYLKKFGYND